MRSFRLLPLVCLAGILSGCGPSGTDEIRAWMQELRATMKPGVTPISEPKQFFPQAYAESGVDPFNPVKLTQALRRESSQSASNASLIAPEMARRKEPLEAYPLDAMAMVGSLNKSGSQTALLNVNGLIYQVKTGNYLGQNYGKIIKITESGIQLREIIQDATGDWVERVTALDLQEGKGVQK